MATLGSYIFNEPNKLLKAGSSGPDVMDLQATLGIMFGPTLGVIVPTGTYNSDTAKFVAEFQNRAGIAVDGKFGRDSRATLARVWNAAMGTGPLAAGIPGYPGIGPAVLQRLRTVGGAMVATNTTVASKPAVVVPGKVVAADDTPTVPGSTASAEPKGLWAMFKAPVKLPFIDVRVPRWTIFGGGALLLGGVVSVFSRRR